MKLNQLGQALLNQFKHVWMYFLTLCLEAGKDEVCSFLKFSKTMAQRIIKMVMQSNSNLSEDDCWQGSQVALSIIELSRIVIV